MVVIHSGVSGVGAVGHVMEEPSNATVHAPIPRLQTVVKTAVSLAELWKHGDVTRIRAQVIFFLNKTLVY